MSEELFSSLSTPASVTTPRSVLSYLPEGQLCPTIETNSRGLEIRLPGGTTITAQLPGLNPPKLHLAQQIMAQSSAAMAAMQPLFDIVGVLLALGELVKALVSNPFKLAAEAEELFTKLGKLASFVPLLCIPAFLLDILEVLLHYVEGLANAIDALAAQEARITRAVAVAEQHGLAFLQQAAACCSDMQEAQIQNIRNATGPLNSMIRLINAFGSLIPGMPAVPEVGTLDEEFSVASTALREMVATIREMKKLVPI